MKKKNPCSTKCCYIIQQRSHTHFGDLRLIVWYWSKCIDQVILYKFYGFWRWIKFPKYIYVIDWNNCNELIQMHLAASKASTLHMLYYLFQIFSFNCNLQSVFFSMQNGHESSTLCFVQLATKPYQNMQNLEFQVNGLPASHSLGALTCMACKAVTSIERVRVKTS